MRSFVSFIFVSLTAVLLSSCGGGGGGGGDSGGARPATVTPRPPSPVNVGVSFEADVQGARLEATTDTTKQRAKDASGGVVGHAGGRGGARWDVAVFRWSGGFCVTAGGLSGYRERHLYQLSFLLSSRWRRFSVSDVVLGGQGIDNGAGL